MCRIRNCKRHEFNVGLCLTHLKEAVEAGVAYGEVASWQPKDTRRAGGSRKKKVDAITLSTTDDTNEMETREALNAYHNHE